MSHKLQTTSESSENLAGLPALALLSLVVGAASGLIGALFRLTLEQADGWREALIHWAQGCGPGGCLLVISACAGATALAAWLVHRFSPHAAGSGIPHVEAVLNEKLPQAPFRLIPVKFIGGVLAIGAGLALGREGPTVQLGASVAHFLGKVFRCHWADCRLLLAAGAGAGLATAFNAPIAGAVFVLEELFRRFDLRMTIVTFGASTSAITVARLFLGQSPDFHVAPLPFPSLETLPYFLALGLLAGLLGVAYNRAILGALTAAERLQRWPVELRAALIGGAVGLLGWFAPNLIGGGESLTRQTLAGAEAVAFLPLIFLLRFGLGAISYAAATPGGLFAPMLVLGSQLGLYFGTVCGRWLPDGGTPMVYAVTGMAAFFTAVVRAPLTGIILVIELTGSYTLLLPMLGASFTALLVPTLLCDPPIYDSLRPTPAGPSKPG